MSVSQLPSETQLMWHLLYLITWNKESESLVMSPPCKFPLSRCFLISKILYLYETLLSVLLWFVQPELDHPGGGTRVLIVAQSGMNCRGMSATPVRRTCFSRWLPSPLPWKAPLVNKAPHVLEVLGPHHCCRVGSYYLNLVEKC